MKGTKGAISLHNVLSASNSVWYAASLSLSDFAFQNLRRERRMYQFDRSSTKRWIRLAGSIASYLSSPPDTDEVSPLSFERSHRSSTFRSPTGTWACDGSNL